MKLVVADYSMMELRLAAHYSRDAKMMQAFAEGLDLHTLTAAGQNNLTYEELKARIEEGDVQAKLMRFIGKTSNFGLLYGMAARKFQVMLWVDVGIKLPLDEVQRLVKQFEQTYEGVTKWKGDVVRYARSHGLYTQTLNGNRRHLPDLLSEDRMLRGSAERQGVNYVIQGSCAEIMNEAIPPVQAGLAPLGGYVLLQVHDELVSEVPAQHAEMACRLIETYMTGFINPRLRVPLVVEAHYGDSWSEAK